jgi:hypothetical protein
MMADVDDDNDRRDRSPRFPYINLTLAVERARQLHAAVKGNAVRLVDAADDWSVSPTSSSTLRIAAAMLAYGLISDEGSGDSRRIRLTPEALRILTDTRPGVREKLLAESALRSPIIEEYFGKWGRDRPSDGHAVSSLKFDSGFGERAARTFLGVYDDIVSYIPDDAQNRNVVQDPVVELDVDTVQKPSEEMSLTRNAGAKAAEQKEHEWLRVRVSKDVTVRILVDGVVVPRMIERLITVLNAQKEVMDDDF